MGTDGLSRNDGVFYIITLRGSGGVGEGRGVFLTTNTGLEFGLAR